MKITTKNIHRHVRFFDNGGKTFDRYTAVYLFDKQPMINRRHVYGCVGMSENPFHPQGFGQHSTCVSGNHLGKQIFFKDLPENCQKLVLQDVE